MRSLRLLAVCLLPYLVGCIPLPALFASPTVKKEQDRFEKNMKNENYSKIREQCKEPAVVFNPPFKKWTETEWSGKACEVLKQRWEEKLAEASAVGAEDPGKCIKAVGEVGYYAWNIKDKYKMEWEVEAEVHKRTGPIAEPCIAKMEEMANAGQFIEVLELVGPHRHNLTNHGLTAEQNERAELFLTRLYPGIAKQWADKAEEGKKTVEARAFYYAAATSYVSGHDDALSAEYRKKALAEFEKSKVSSVTRIGLKKGKELGGEIVKRVQDKGFNSGIRLVAKGDHNFEVSLTEPSFNHGTKHVKKSVTWQVKEGQRLNNDWKNARSHCDDRVRGHAEYKECCYRKGPCQNREHKCRWYKEWAVKVKDCEAKVASFDKYIPAWIDKTAEYSAKEFWGNAKGTMDYVLDGKAEQYPVSGSSANYEHDAVPEANLSASRGGKVSEKALRSLYLSDATDTIVRFIRELHAKRARGYIDQAEAAADVDAAVTGLVQFVKASGMTPSEDTSRKIDEKYGVPAVNALRILEK